MTAPEYPSSPSAVAWEPGQPYQPQVPAAAVGSAPAPAYAPAANLPAAMPSATTAAVVPTPPMVVGQPTAAVPERALTRQFAFDGGAATFVGTAMLGALITFCTAFICYPFALVLLERWRAKHSFIEGRQLVFNGSAIGLFGLWWKWLLLMLVTAGIYSFWVVPRIQRWKWENTAYAVQAPGTYSVAVR